MVCYSPEKRQKLQLNPSSINHPSKSLAFLRIQQRVSTLKVKNTPYQRKKNLHRLDLQLQYNDALKQQASQSQTSFGYKHI